jgi:hypothetical protein
MPSSSLPCILTPELLKSIREHPDLPPHSWYIIAAATLTILNRPDENSKAYEHALNFRPSKTASKADYEHQLKILRRMREALIKTTAVGGVPKVVTDYFFWKTSIYLHIDHKFAISS